MTTVPSPRKRTLLDWEVANIKSFLDDFEPLADGRSRHAWYNKTGEFIVVRGFPLPDAYRPDWVDVLLSVTDYPANPPIGIYLLNANNDAVIRRIRNALNVFRDRAYHDAEAVAGYTWVCAAYKDNRWNFRADNPRGGDNIGKFLETVHGHLEEEAKR